MTIICRSQRIGAAESAALAAASLSVADAVASSRNYSDVYRYWDGISFLLQRLAPDSAAAGWRSLGTEASPGDGPLPGLQHLPPPAVKRLAAELSGIEPEALVEHYDATALDAANVYPACWQRWEETFDPLGQLLEHFHFLKQVTEAAARAGDALVLLYEDDGDEPFYEDEEDLDG